MNYTLILPLLFFVIVSCNSSLSKNNGKLSKNNLDNVPSTIGNKQNSDSTYRWEDDDSLSHSLLVFYQKKAIINRGFFVKMDTITKYNCSCLDRYKRISRKNIYIYISQENNLNNKYYFNIFPDTNMKILNEAKKYSDLIHYSKDTLFFESLGNNHLIFSKLYNFKEKHYYKDSLLNESNLFFLFKKRPKNKWKAPNKLLNFDSIQVRDVKRVKGIDVYQFETFDYTTMVSHFPHILRFFIVPEIGILGFEYYSGISMYDCWISK